MGAIDHTASTPLFRGLPQEHHEKLARLIEQRNFKPGELTSSEGDEGIGFYVILSGRVKVFRFSLDGREQLVRIFGPGNRLAKCPSVSST